ncbi:MAG: GntR family transcriptional regulator [Anaerolineae bacterium]|nr:GntR family transcriptional regulator [Anaerolineae bacterium]MDW8300062.1 GntR family transcriptional regulator [Anaerolineae bacterium]
MTDSSVSEVPQPKQLRDIAVERLRAMIAQGRLRGGEWLRQAALAAELGISYTPIREALKQLEAEGLVEHVPYRGVRVVKFRPDDILDVYSIRMALEPQAAYSAAQRITEPELAALRDLYERMCELHGADVLARARELNEQFHLKIAEASRRTYLIRTVRAIWTWFPKMLWSQFLPDSALVGLEEQDNAEHAQILGALEAHDAEAAERAMYHHIKSARQVFIDILSQRAQD